MKKVMLFLLFMIILLLTLSCSKSTETINDEIIERIQSLITYNWELNNIKMTYDDYQQEVSTYFINKNEFNAHIKNAELSPMIIENVKGNDSSRVEKYKRQNLKNYDLLDVKISKVYGESSSTKRYVYIHMIVSPSIVKQVKSNVVYAKGGYTFKEERNLLIELTSEKNNTWKISDIQGNSYLIELKEKLSKEFVNRYTIHNNGPIEYIKTFELKND